MGFRGLGNYGRILGPLPDVEAYEFLGRFAGISTLCTGFSGVC